MLELIAVGFALPWVIVLGALAAERWLESSLRSTEGTERDEDRRRNRP
jgi:hypothetical protein